MLPWGSLVLGRCVRGEGESWREEYRCYRCDDGDFEDAAAGEIGDEALFEGLVVGHLGLFGGERAIEARLAYSVYLQVIELCGKSE